MIQSALALASIKSKICEGLNKDEHEVIYKDTSNVEAQEAVIWRNCYVSGMCNPLFIHWKQKKCTTCKCIEKRMKRVFNITRSLSHFNSNIPQLGLAKPPFSGDDAWHDALIPAFRVSYFARIHETVTVGLSRR